MEAKQFGQFIAGIRKEKKMTQAELAEKIHVTDKAISRWERGLGFPDIQTLEPLAQVLGISVLELMRSEKKKPTGDMDTTETQYTQKEVAEMLQNADDISKQLKKQDKNANIIAGIAIGAVFLSAFFLILIMRDITRSNRYRRQLEEANKRAEDLLVAREKLMLAITHDFKAPLGSIMGYTELLSRLTEDERQRFYLDNMKSSSEHLLKLVSDLLDFHRLDLNKAEVNRIVFNPAQLFEEIRVCFEPLTAAKGLVLQCHIAPELSEKYISDPLRIQQIVNNLLSNAVKFTQQGKITLTVGYNASKLTIAVADTGKGMASEDRERIFQEFTRLPGAQGEEGFGLGLSIVHKLVLLLEGTIDVQSTLGKGSCFTVVLPLFPVGKSIVENKPFGSRIKKPSKDTDVSPEETDAVPVMKVIRVLLIDDDKIQLNLTAAMLKQHNIDAVCCEQLEELIEQLRSSTFDVLLTDIQMPAINGFDYCVPLTFRKPAIFLSLLSRHVAKWMRRLCMDMALPDACTNLLR